MPREVLPRRPDPEASTDEIVVDLTHPLPTRPECDCSLEATWRRAWQVGEPGTSIPAHVCRQRHDPALDGCYYLG